MTTTKAAELGLPEWGTKAALLWGVAHPDNPFVSDEARAEYAYPDGSWWRERFPDGVPSPDECTAPAGVPRRRNVDVELVDRRNP